MRTVELGRTGLEVPAIGLGTWGYGGAWSVGQRPVGWSATADSTALAALREAHAQGLVHWDTADVYGRGKAEALLGRLWAEVPRPEVVLASKVGWMAGDFPHAYHPRQIRHQLETSLARLRTDWIDIYYFHRCDFGPRDALLDDALSTFRELRAEGKIRFIGLSDWHPDLLLRYARRLDPDVVQLHHSVLDDDYRASGIAAWARASGAGVIFFSPLVHGLLIGRGATPRVFDQGDHRRAIPAFSDPALLAHFHAARLAVEARFASEREPLLAALTGALFTDAPEACLLLGLRTCDQVRAAAAVGRALAPEDAAWVRALYRALPASAPPLANPWAA